MKGVPASEASGAVDYLKVGTKAGAVAPVRPFGLSTTCGVKFSHANATRRGGADIPQQTQEQRLLSAVLPGAKLFEPADYRFTGNEMVNTTTFAYLSTAAGRSTNSSSKVSPAPSTTSCGRSAKSTSTFFRP